MSSKIKSVEPDIKKEIKWCMQKEEQGSFMAEKIRQTDAVLIGGGSGLSSATEYKINIVGKEM